MTKRIILTSFILILVGCLISECSKEEDVDTASNYQYTPDSVLTNAFENQISNLQVLINGVVISILPDDTIGEKYQRFILELKSKQTLLIAHNIDIALRVDNLKNGDTLVVFGEYEWNDEGGVIHWTHRDLDGIHVDGWIEKNGIRYE